MDILQEIVAHKRLEIERMKARRPEKELHAMVERIFADAPSAVCPSMSRALLESPTGIIAEFKRKSPSAGWINREADPGVIPLGYERNGAAALSILTDEAYFGGCDRHIAEAMKSGVTVPVLYKNFVVDEYQLFQARLSGASAVLLIAAVLSPAECRHYVSIARELGMETLLEIHSASELGHAEAGPDMYGVNNRNLGTFRTDVHNSFEMAERLPEDACKVSESGITDPSVASMLRQAGFHGLLVGSRFMMTADPCGELGRFVAELETSHD